QNVVIGSTNQPSGVFLDGLGSLTLGNISGGTTNPAVNVTARANLVVATGATLNSGTGATTLGADLTAAGAGDAGSGTLTVNASAAVYGASITLRGADEDIAATATVGNAAIPTTASATLTGVSGPNKMVFDSSGNLFVVNLNNFTGTTVSKFAPGG